jgi:hypothetical protein
MCGELPEAGPGAEVGRPEARVLILLPLPRLFLEGGAGRLPQVHTGLQPARPGEGRTAAAARLSRHSPRRCLQADIKRVYFREGQGGGVAYPDPGSGAFLTLDPDPRPGIPDTKPMFLIA